MLPFNLITYISMLEKALSIGYSFICFDEIKNLYSRNTLMNVGENEVYKNVDYNSLKISNGNCLLRHDINVNLSAAVTMAEAESKLGIKSTYFLMWRSPCYNLMSRANQLHAESIVEFGHQIGLHYDQGFDSQRQLSASETEEQISQQSDWLEKLLGIEISAVSFHQPSSVLLQSGMECRNRINTYDKVKLKDFFYISDSNRIFSPWHADNLLNNLNQFEKSISNYFPQNIQLLIHPIWWIFEENSTELCWNQALLNNFEELQQQLIDTERAYGLKRKLSLELDNGNKIIS